jgi:hypothetical protein
MMSIKAINMARPFALASGVSFSHTRFRVVHGLTLT